MEKNHGEREAESMGECKGPPGERMEPTAEEREMLLGRTRKDVEPGIIRSPYRSPIESKIWFCASAACRCAHCQSAVWSSVFFSVQNRQTTEASRSSTNDPGVRSVN